MPGKSLFPMLVYSTISIFIAPTVVCIRNVLATAHKEKNIAILNKNNPISLESMLFPLQD